MIDLTELQDSNFPNDLLLFGLITELNLNI